MPRDVRSAALSSRSPDAARFLPGTILAGRYRVFGLLGRGGMGEVYRADDLKLGQPVALKFLPRGLEHDRGRRERFLKEVKLSRQVAHPNVCRVYDVGEVDGQTFLSMEYVDGEDLASLLRRIGRPPRDKAAQIARELCAGVSAAHSQGILHRDLKPANVMIDGRGHVCITDFGLAGLLSDDSDTEGRVGTPGYMAPEQIAGGAVSIQSDLYSLGLVLYELFTGRRAFEAESPTEFNRLQREAAPAHPSLHLRGLDLSIERAIMSCLESDARGRPASALAVAASLPGSDPLAEAVAAGETPSPDLVASAGGSAGLKPAVARACLICFALLLTGVVWVGERSRFLTWLPPEKPVGYLAERGRELCRVLGDDVPAIGEAFGHVPNWGYLNEISVGSAVERGWEALREVQPSALHFWYRTSPRPLVPASYRVGPDDPPRAVAGMTAVELDSQGLLRSFDTVPAQEPSAGPTETRVAWDPFFAAAGLDAAELQPSAPRVYPRGYADRRYAWRGRYPLAPHIPIRVEAAALEGSPVYFEVFEPWDDPVVKPDTRRNQWSRLNSVGPALLLLPALVCGSLLARRNLLQGSGDRKSAFRLGAFMFILWLVFGVLRRDHVPDPMAEFRMLVRALAMAFLNFGLFWVLYVALEPYVRRLWPRMMVSWVRLLDGRFRDPLVARHLLIGSLLGCVCALVEHLGVLSSLRLGEATWGPGAIGFQLETLRSFRFTVAGFLDLLDFGVTTTLEILVVLLLLRMVLRVRWLAVVVAVVLLTVIFSAPSVMLTAHALEVSLALAVLLRFGLLSMMTGVFVFVLSGNYLISLDPGSSFAGCSYLALTIVVAIAVYGYRRAVVRAPFLPAPYPGWRRSAPSSASQ